MYKFYSKNGTAQFYEHGVEIDGTVYGIRTDSDILRIKRSVLNSKFAESEEDFQGLTVVDIFILITYHIKAVKHSLYADVAQGQSTSLVMKRSGVQISSSAFIIKMKRKNTLYSL